MRPVRDVVQHDVVDDLDIDAQTPLQRGWDKPGLAGGNGFHVKPRAVLFYPALEGLELEADKLRSCPPTAAPPSPRP